MSEQRNSIRLRHMLDHAREAIALTEGRTRQDLESDRLLELALVRLLEIVGEAASRVSQEDRSRYRNIPWLQIISLRNRLIHGYDAVDQEILLQIATHDLPSLVTTLEEILQEHDSE